MATVTTPLLVFALVLSMLAAVVIVLGYNRIRQGPRRSAEKGSRSPVAAEGRAEGAGEHRASAAAELMQDIVRREMAADPSLSGRSIDFATAADGSLEIWLDDKSYAGVDQIPDARLRELIARAVEEFNRKGPAVS